MRAAWDTCRQKANLQAKSLFSNKKISSFPSFLGCQSPPECKCYHFRCFIKAKGPREDQGYKITRRPVFENVGRVRSAKFLGTEIRTKALPSKSDPENAFLGESHCPQAAGWHPATTTHILGKWAGSGSAPCFCPRAKILLRDNYKPTTPPARARRLLQEITSKSPLLFNLTANRAWIYCSQQCVLSSLTADEFSIIFQGGEQACAC